MTDSARDEPTSPQTETPAAEQEPTNKIFAERGRIERLERIRQLVFGSLDGLLVPLGVVSGVAGGVGSSQAVIVAGIAEAFAGALSMGAGEFISARAEAQVQQTEIQKEHEEIRLNPAYERREMVQLLQSEGVTEADASQMVDILERYPHSFTTTMIQKELGLQADVSTVRIPEALTMGVSYIIGSVFPLIAYFIFPVRTALPISILLTIVALIIIGFIKGKLASLNLVISIVEVVIVGGVSALGGYLLGTFVPRLFGY